MTVQKTSQWSLIAWNIFLIVCIYLLSDQDMVKTCLNGVACEFMTVAEARMLEAQAVNSVEAVKGEPELVKALTPSLTTMTESINSLQAQKAVSKSSILDPLLIPGAYCYFIVTFA